MRIAHIPPNSSDARTFWELSCIAWPLGAGGAGRQGAYRGHLFPAGPGRLPRAPFFQGAYREHLFLNLFAPRKGARVAAITTTRAPFPQFHYHEHLLQRCSCRCAWKKGARAAASRSPRAPFEKVLVVCVLGKGARVAAIGKRCSWYADCARKK